MKISNWKICRNVAKRIRFHSFYNSQDVSRKYDFLFPPPIDFKSVNYFNIDDGQ